jgi:hypothetical protein
VLQEFDFVGARQIDAAGTFFLYDTANLAGDQAIRLLVGGQPIGKYLPGDRITLPEAARRWEIQPVTPGMSGRVVVGFGKVESARLAGTVSVSSGTVGVSGVVYTALDQNYAQVERGVSSVGVSVTQVVPGEASRRALRFRNAGTREIVLGGVNVTFGGGPLRLAPGDIWVEKVAAAAAWYAVSDQEGQLLQSCDVRR